MEQLDHFLLSRFCSHATSDAAVAETMTFRHCNFDGAINHVFTPPGVTTWRPVMSDVPLHRNYTTAHGLSWEESFGLRRRLTAGHCRRMGTKAITMPETCSATRSFPS
ncbi:hypothetical protein J6590_003140 [Homalodisca vitripennis]|nr:hypothetical protein J6590_003140 [Homalodisca vitripennis]